jgi:AdoMet-dependent heme synthase
MNQSQLLKAKPCRKALAIAPVVAPLLPSIFTLELTTLCNNRCTGCANIEVPAQRLLRQDQHRLFMQDWRVIIQRIITQTDGKAVIRLSGGEPTLHPEFKEIVTYLDSFGVSHALLTTGRWQKVGEENLIDLYKNCKNSVGLLVSLHGADAVTHQSFVETSEKAFVETIDNIKKATQSGITVFTNTVITNQNFHQIAAIAQLSRELGATYAIFNRFLASHHRLLPTNNQLLTAIKTVQALRQQGVACRIGNKIPACFYPLTNYPTVSGFELCHISPQGGIRPDNLTPLQVGTIQNTPLSKIWSSEAIHQYRESVPTACLDCAAFASCRGGAKSLYSAQTRFADPLMQAPLSIEQSQRIDDDKEKKSIKLLALTSD